MTEIYNNLLELKQISLDIAIADYKKLQTLDTNTTVNSRVGTKFIDYLVTYLSFKYIYKKIYI